MCENRSVLLFEAQRARAVHLPEPATSVSRRSIPLFRAGAAGGGYCPELQSHPDRVIARKRPVALQVEFAAGPCMVQTKEGAVAAATGDAIITGTAGERWPVGPKRFSAAYRPVPPTVAGQSGTYETLPAEILALRMTGTFEVLLTGGSRLRGERGDWLVDYGDGSLGIVAAALFLATYEIIG
jgi:hypothetical protein